MAQSQLYPVGAAVVLLATIYIAQRVRLGPHADWIEVVRATCLPILDPVIERAVGGVGAGYEIGDEEFVGVIDKSPKEVEQLLWEAGCRRNVLSAYKSLEDGREQVGAWVYRESMVVGERMQVDVMLFRAPAGGTVVAAHHEYSSALAWLWRDPTVLQKHYQGTHYDPETGARIVQSELLTSADWR